MTLEQYWRLQSNKSVIKKHDDSLSRKILYYCFGEYASSKEIHEFIGNEPKNNIIRETINKLINDGYLERCYPHRNDNRQKYRFVKGYRTIPMQIDIEQHLCWITHFNLFDE